MKLVVIVGKLVVIALALIGAFSLLVLAKKNEAAPYGGDAHVRFFLSPDSSMKAALVTYAGGGAISPYCWSQVSVVPSSGSEAEAQDKKFAVFTGGCDGFSVRDGRVEPSPRVEWLSNSELKVTSSINSTLLTPATVTMKKRDASGRVTIRYEAHE